MRATADHLELAPPSEPGAGRAMGLSLAAHLMLALALAWGVRWTQSNPQVAFSAELWSPTVQEAAPAAVEPPPAPPPPPAESRPAPPPPPVREAEQPKADIAIEREKKRKEEERRKLEAQKAKAEKERAEKEKADKEKLAKEKARKEEARKEEEARKLKEKERELAKAKEQARREAAAQAAQDKLRQDQLARIQGMAGATGGPEAKGTAQRSAAPSSSYAGKIIRLISDNYSYAGSSAGNPSVVVLVKAAPSGAILSRRVVTSSGNKAYDEAVLRAVDKMGNVPKDVDGRIPDVLLQEGLEIKVTL